MKGFQSKHWAWWYLSISVGFILLNVVWLMRNGNMWAIIVRAIISLGFAALAWMQWKYGR